jgi:hypothetical protein
MHSSSNSPNKKFCKSNLQNEYELNYKNNNHNNKKNDTNDNNDNCVRSESESYNHKEEPAYSHLNLIFFGLFREHNYSPEDKFDKNVWFLKNNLEFQKLLNSFDNSANNGKTPEGSFSSTSLNCEVIRVLQECSIGGKSLKSFFVEVKKFVNEISKVVFDANQRKTNAEEMVKHYKMDEMKELILDKLQKERANLTFLNDITEIQFSISKLDEFPEGAYNFGLACEAFADSESPLIQTQEIRKKLLGNKKITINTLNADQKFISPEFFEVIEIRNEKNYEYLNLEEVSLSQSKFVDEASYIGLLLYNFKFSVFKNEVFFASSEPETLIDNLINQLVTLLKDKAFKCSSAAFAYVDSSNPNFEKAGLENKQLVIYYDLEINFNKKTKLLALEKIYNVFYDTITTKFDNEKIINNILNYFYEVSRDVNDILNENKNVKVDQCNPCTNCAIF